MKYLTENNDKYFFNPIKAGGSESITWKYLLILKLSCHVYKRALENRYKVEMHVYSPVFQGQLIEKKRSITFIVWVLGRVKKMPKKSQKNVKNIFFV